MVAGQEADGQSRAARCLITNFSFPASGFPTIRAAVGGLNPDVLTRGTNRLRFVTVVTPTSIMVAWVIGKAVITMMPALSQGSHHYKNE